MNDDITSIVSNYDDEESAITIQRCWRRIAAVADVQFRKPYFLSHAEELLRRSCKPCGKAWHSRLMLLCNVQRQSRYSDGGDVRQPRIGTVK